jgi:hypothetical protein
MTISQLYGLYRAGYLEARAFVGPCAGAGAADGGIVVAGEGLAPLERVILELALHDLTNGSAMRSLDGFERAVRQGAALLVSLGLELGPAQIGRAA